MQLCVCVCVYVCVYCYTTYLWLHITFYLWLLIRLIKYYNIIMYSHEMKRLASDYIHWNLTGLIIYADSPDIDVARSNIIRNIF